MSCAVSMIGAVAIGSIAAGAQSRQSTAASGSGTISGHVKFSGPPPGGAVIRMGMDPKCSALNAGSRVVEQSAVVALDGGVANVFVRLDGKFPATTVPGEPVIVDQRRCIFGPRVVGMRLGQKLRVRNDDDVLHDVHTSSAVGNSFTASQPKAGIVSEFTPKAGEVMLKLGCDIHRWMIAYVGVVTHPYFAVTDPSGAFAIGNVPPGTYTLRLWHERFGEQSTSVIVKGAQTTSVALKYQGTGRGKE